MTSGSELESGVRGAEGVCGSACLCVCGRVQPLTSTKLTESPLFTEWHAEFIDKTVTPTSVEGLYELSLAANFLGIPHLVHLSCAKIAALFREGTPEEALNRLGLVTRLTEEQKRDVAARDEFKRPIA